MSAMNNAKIPNWLDPEPRRIADHEQVKGIREEARVLVGLVDGFCRLFPKDWEELRLCPLQHGLETMAEKLRHYHPPIGA